MTIIFHTHPRHSEKSFKLKQHHQGHPNNPLIPRHSQQIIQILELSDRTLVLRVLADEMFLRAEVNLDVEVVLQVDCMLLGLLEHRIHPQILRDVQLIDDDFGHPLRIPLEIDDQ